MQAKLGTQAGGRLGRTQVRGYREATGDHVARRLVVRRRRDGGGVVSALGIEGLCIGREIDPGVPWTTSLTSPRLALALKSGNFGADDFFLKAFQ